MPVIGLTGALGAGKSTVAAVFARHGATIVDADAIGHVMLRRGGPCFDALVGRFGADVVGRDGEIVRAELGRRAFADPASTAALNAIVHPPLVAELIARVREAERPGHAVVVDAALLLEWGAPVPLATTIVVTAPADERIGRMARRLGVSRADAARRGAAQMPEDEKARRADIVIENDGTLEELTARAERVWDELARTLGVEDDARHGS